MCMYRIMTLILRTRNDFVNRNRKNEFDIWYMSLDLGS